MKIVGYSERGIINSLIFSIVERKKELMTAFIKQIELPNKIDIGEPDSYEILLEQSFSQFGDSDLVIIAHYINPSDKKVLFFEGKVKTWGVNNWNLSNQYIKFNAPIKYDGYSSNLFFQLKSKELLIKYLNGIIEKDKYEKHRKLGENGVVHLAVEKLKSASQYYYIGIIPRTEVQIEGFLNNEYKCEFPIQLLAWETIQRFCEKQELQKVLEIFTFNKGQIY